MIQNILSQVTPEQLEKLEANIGKVVPFIEQKLPMLTELENAWRKEHNLNAKDIFMYSAIKTPSNKILIYVNAVGQTKESVLLTDGTRMAAGTPIVKQQIKSFDLLEFLNTLTSNGLTGLISTLF